MLSVASAKFSDADGNINRDGSDADNIITLSVDTLRPTVAISSDASSLKAGETANLTFKLSETSTDFTASDITFSGGSISGFSGSGTSYSATFTPSTDSTINGWASVASDKFCDAAGNFNRDGSEANNSIALSIDTVAPIENKTSGNTGSNNLDLTFNKNFTLRTTATSTAPSPSDSFLTTSNGLIPLKFQSSHSRLLDSEGGGGGGGGASSRQSMRWNQLSHVDLKNGIRIMLPNLYNTDWKDQISNQPKGEIPILISLSEQPDQEAKVELQAKNLSAELSANVLYFTPENWDKPQIIWANLNAVRSFTTDSKLDIITSLQIGDASHKIEIEIFSISLPESNSLLHGASAQESKNINHTDPTNPNLDLELLTVREEESLAFFLLKTVLSPFILITSMVKHSIQQVKYAQAEKQYEALKNNQPSNENSPTSELPQESKQVIFKSERIELNSYHINNDNFDKKREDFPPLPLTSSISFPNATKQQAKSKPNQNSSFANYSSLPELQRRSDWSSKTNENNNTSDHPLGQVGYDNLINHGGRLNTSTNLENNTHAFFPCSLDNGFYKPILTNPDGDIYDYVSSHTQPLEFTLFPFEDNESGIISN